MINIFPPYENYPNKTFDELITSANDLETIIPESYKTYLTNIDLTLIYNLLSARYGVSVIAGNDENKFKQQLALIIFQYAPSWYKQLDVQNKLVGLTEDDLIKGTVAINNHAYNPSTTVDDSYPGPNPEYGEITSVNEQTSTKYRKSKIDAYSSLLDVLSNDVTEQFIRRFKHLFVTLLVPYPRWTEE